MAMQSGFPRKNGVVSTNIMIFTLILTKGKKNKDLMAKIYLKGEKGRKQNWKHIIRQFVISYHQSH